MSVKNIQTKWEAVQKHFFRSMTTANESELFVGIIGIIRVVLAFLMVGAVILFPRNYIYTITTMKPASLKSIVGTNLVIVLAFIVLYLIWTGRLLYLYLRQKDIFQSKGLRNTQIIFDSIFAVGFYILHFQPRSRLYLSLAVLPIILAGRHYKSFKRLLVYLVCFLLGFAGAILVMYVKDPSMFFATSNVFPMPFGAVFYVWFPDAVILTAVAFFTYYYDVQKRDIVENRKILQDISKELVQETQIRQLAILFCKKTTEIISPVKQKNSTLHLYNPQTKMLELIASYPTEFSRAGALDFELGKGIAGIALRDLRSINVPDRMKDKRFIVKKEGRNYKALLVVPLYIGEKLIGTFSIDSDKVDAFDAVDIEQVELLAAWAAVALANALDFANRQKKYQQIQDILFYSQKTLKPQKGIEQLMRDVVHGANILLDAENASVCLFGVVPYALPVGATDMTRSMKQILTDIRLQNELQTYLKSHPDVFLHKYPAAPDRQPFSYHIPLIASQNRAIGVLSITCDPGSITSKEDSQTMWLFATQAARELEMALSLEFRKKIEEVVTGFRSPFTAITLAEQLQSCFQDIGFKRGFVKVHPFLGETAPGCAWFGITGHEAMQIKQNLTSHWKNAAPPKTGVRIVYVPWKEVWAREHFAFDPDSKKSEQGFFIIRFVNRFKQIIFEIILSVSSQVSLSEKNWKNDLKLYVDRIADTIENVRLASRQAFDMAAKEEREWLQNDIHDTLNILHGGPLLIGEAVQNTLKTALPIDHREWNAENGDLQARRQVIQKIENNLTSIIEGTRFAYDNLNQLMTELRQPTLRDRGLREALLELGRVLELDSIMQVDIPQNLEFCLTTEMQYGLYRIGMEAINNAKKHSGILDETVVAEPKIIVTLIKENDTLRYSIEDNGCGFSVEKKNTEITSFGLRQMKRWVKKIHGELELESAINVGTTVTVRLHCS